MKKIYLGKKLTDIRMTNLRYQYSHEELEKLIFNFEKVDGIKTSDYPSKVKIWDETLRDGEQTPGVSLNSADKIEIALKLDQIGVAKFAAGFPAVSPNELEAVKEIQKLGLSNSQVMAIARPKISDIEACLKCDLEEIVLFMPISDLMMKLLRESRESELEKIQDSYDFSREHGLKYNWVSEDCTRAHPDHIINVFQKAIENKAESIIIGDTVGILQPHTTSYLMEMIKKGLNWNKDLIPIGIHTHNDYGLAVSNTLSAVYHGATLPHVCINGYGERAGNAALDEVVVNLERMNIQTGIKMDKLFETSKLAEDKFNLPISAHKPVVGDNAFSHESGLHINAIIAHPMSYEPIKPTSVGQIRKLYLGKFSGLGAIVNALETKLEQSDLQLPKDVLMEIVSDVKIRAENVSREEKLEIYNQIMKLGKKLRRGITDTVFFQIVEKHAGKFLKGTWADPEME